MDLFRSDRENNHINNISSVQIPRCRLYGVIEYREFAGGCLDLSQASIG